MKNLLCATAIAAALFTTGCNNSGADNTTVSKDSSATTMTADTSGANKMDTSAAAMNTAGTGDADFAMKAANGGMTEVMASKLAQKNGTAAVKDVAAMMIKDHTAGGDELKALAQKNSIMLPDGINADSQKKLDDLSAKKGSDFDKAYLDMLEGDHKSTIDLFQTEASGGTNAELKNWASGKIPVFQHHLQMVTDAKGKMK